MAKVPGTFRDPDYINSVDRKYAIAMLLKKPTMPDSAMHATLTDNNPYTDNAGLIITPEERIARRRLAQASPPAAPNYGASFRMK